MAAPSRASSSNQILALVAGAVILAVTSFGLNGNCVGVGGAYRIDQADDLAWLARFLEDDGDVPQ